MVAAAFAALAMLRVARYAWYMLPRVEGWEADFIARAIAGGHGFSFPGNWRWLWDMSSGNPGEFFPTAWADPVYTHLLAGLHVLLGEHAYAGAFAVSFVCIGIIFYCVYRLGSRIRGAWSGALAVILLALHGETFVSFFGDINSTGFATCILTAYVLVAVRYFEAPSRLRLATLGLATGVMVLVWPAAVYFAYALIAAVAVYHRARLRTAALRAAMVLGLAAIVVMPWTVRNYLTFGEYVLVRTGSGELMYSATIAAASTFMPGVARTTVPAPWTSSGPDGRGAHHPHRSREAHPERALHGRLDPAIAAPGLRADERGAARPDLFAAREGVRADLPVGRGPDGRRRRCRFTS